MVQALHLNRDHILLTLRPRWAEAILRQSKTVEIRRRPMRLDRGTLAIIYAGAPVQRVVGQCRIDSVHRGRGADIWARFGDRTALTRSEFRAYVSGSEVTCLELKEPSPAVGEIPLRFRPPQSWMRLHPHNPAHRDLLVRTKAAV